MSRFENILWKLIYAFGVGAILSLMLAFVLPYFLGLFLIFLALFIICFLISGYFVMFK